MYDGVVLERSTVDVITTLLYLSYLFKEIQTPYTWIFLNHIFFLQLAMLCVIIILQKYLHFIFFILKLY